jgi:hypothetical protein
MYPVAVILQYTIQYNTIDKKQKKHKITRTHSKQYTTQNLRYNNNIQRNSPTIPSDLVQKQLRIAEINWPSKAGVSNFFPAKDYNC